MAFKTLFKAAPAPAPVPETESPRNDGLPTGFIKMDDHPAYQAAKAELDAVEKRKAKSEERRAHAIGIAQNKNSKSKIKDIARNLVAGAMVQGAPVAQELDAVETERYALDLLSAEKYEALDQVVGELSFEVAKLFRPQVDELHRVILSALETAAAAALKIHEIHAEIVRAGYKSRPDILPCPPRGSAIIGWPKDHNSHISEYRRFLADRGVVSTESNNDDS